MTLKRKPNTKTEGEMTEEIQEDEMVEQTLSLEDVAQQVAYLTRAVSEMAIWMVEVEKSGSVPPGMRDRARDLAQLSRVTARIKSIQNTLGPDEPDSEKDPLRSLLKTSLTGQQKKAAELRLRTL